MAGSCYVSLGLWPGIQVGGERPTLVGAQCLGESGLGKVSKRVRGSGCRDRKGTGSPQKLPFPLCPLLPRGHLAVCPSPRACGESAPPNTSLVWPPGQLWLLPSWVGNGQPFHPPMPEAGSSKPISGELGEGVEASVTGPQSPSGSWAATTGADRVPVARTCSFSLGAPIRVAPVLRDQQRDRRLNGEVRAMGHEATKGRI